MSLPKRSGKCSLLTARGVPPPFGRRGQNTNRTYFFLFFSGAAPGTFLCVGVVVRWHPGWDSLCQRRAAEKQKE